MLLAVFSDIHGNRQAFEACLKVARKEPIVSTDHDVNRNVGPRLEVRGLAEGDLGLRARVRGPFLGDVLWHIVKEIRGEIELVHRDTVRDIVKFFTILIS